MSLINTGQSLEFEPEKIYMVLSSNKETGDAIFEIYDTLDFSKDEAKALACVARGMIEMALHNTEATVKAGMEAFVAENVFSDEDTVPEVDDGIGKPVGSA